MLVEAWDRVGERKPCEALVVSLRVVDASLDLPKLFFEPEREPESPATPRVTDSFALFMTRWKGFLLPCRASGIDRLLDALVGSALSILEVSLVVDDVAK